MKTRGSSCRQIESYHPYKQYTNRRTSFTNSQFKIWKERINNYVYNKISHHLDDLPDQPYRLWFEEGFLKPSHVSHIVLGDYYQLYNLNKLYYLHIHMMDLLPPHEDYLWH